MRRSILLLAFGLLIPACKGHGGGGGMPQGTSAVLATLGSRLFEASRQGSFPAALSGPVLGDNLQLQGLEFDPLTGNLLALDSGRGRLIRIHPTTHVVTEVGLTGFHSLVGLALDPGARKLFASTLYRHLVRVDLATGLATDIGFTGGPTLQGLAYNPAGGILYGVDGSGNNLYTVNPLTGAATFLMSVAPSSALAFDPNTGLLYAVDNTRHSLLKINPGTMTTSFLGGGSNLPSISGLAYVSGSNKLLGVGTQNLYDIDLTTGAITLLAQLGVSGPADIAYDPLLNVFYGVSEALLCKITPQGVMTPIGPTGALIVGVAFEPVTRTLYGSDPLTTGAATPIGAFGVGSIGDLAWDPTTSTLYGLTPGQLYTINTTTGAATLLGPIGFTDLTSLTYDPTTGRLLV